MSSDYARQSTRIEKLGRLMVLVGVSVWAIWLGVLLTGGEPDGAKYLPFHLGGVIPGAILTRWSSIARFLKRGRS